MNRDTIVRGWIKGLRTLADVQLELNGLTALIGENSTGKSSLIEALELLRCSVSGPLVQQINEFHLGLPALLRQGAPIVETPVTPMMRHAVPLPPGGSNRGLFVERPAFAGLK